MNKQEEAIQLLCRTHKRFISTFRKQGSGIRLSMPQIATLFYIKDNTEALLKDVAEHMQITNASASILMKKLEELGLVTKKENTHDKRTTIIRISTKGKTVMNEAEQQLLSSIKPLLKGITNNEWDTLISVFSKILSA